MASGRAYDIVVFGATGFTGRLLAQYLLGRMAEEPFRLAIAGRNDQKLSEVHSALEAVDAERARDVGVIHADVTNRDSIEAMAAQTRVLVSTVGPYMEFGEVVVRACVRVATDYLDITGEGEFVDEMINRYDAKARQGGVRIIHGCGFDCIPSDLGALFTVSRLPAEEKLTLECFVRVYVEHGWSPKKLFQSISGGTWRTALGFMSWSELVRKRQALIRITQLTQDGRRVQPLVPEVRYNGELGVWGVPLPLMDMEVVLRSAARLSRYGRDFSYGHYAAVHSRTRAMALMSTASTLFFLAQLRPARRLLIWLGQTEGPGRAARKTNSFTLTFVGESETKDIVTQVRGGDPGYDETAKMAGESALCLMGDRGQLPHRLGVLTPAIAMGDRLIERLQRAGIEFEVLEGE